MDDIENMTQEEIDDLHMQQWFARTLDAIGNGNHPMAFNENFEDGSHSVPIKGIRSLFTTEESIAFIFPDGFD
eukprot:gene999-1127_t